MKGHQPEVITDILMFNALDYTRNEVADAVNARRGTDLSGPQVGDVANQLEKEAKEADDASEVFERYLMRGASLDVLGEILSEKSLFD